MVSDSSSIEQVIGTSSIQEMEANEKVKSKDTSKGMYSSYLTFIFVSFQIFQKSPIIIE